ncbi:phage tail assembly protein [Billgrantia gudaonensis]|uniref:Phage tail assembly chaperone protein, E, or 41 or 14 n=1 Tax=Billgrantia gudaonensis TaxID=376427 RepID=A0A1G9DUP4_9GAMM|nr:phage tail assembly protein [Halomonas gudaonensis]SDK67573.1 Phage tail assembly chaperone protein, E, or 41 or 14 [Halomonas gudaonensis]
MTDKQTAELPQPLTETVELDVPIQRGSQTVTELTIRKPKSGALRGVALTDVLQMDVTALTTVLPRITQPSLSKAEIGDMDPADLVQCGGVVAGFLLPRKAREGSE